MAKDTPLEKQRGQALQSFGQAVDGRTQIAKERPQVDSEQVKNTKPEPHLKPSPELASGADASVHLQAKSQDNHESREASKQADKKSEQISPDMQSRYENIASKLNQEARIGLAQTQGASQSQGR